MIDDIAEVGMTMIGDMNLSIPAVMWICVLSLCS